jgi:hypothetical protein
MNDNDVIYASYCRGFAKAVMGTPLDGYDFAALSGNSDSVAKAIAAIAIGVSDAKAARAQQTQKALIAAIAVLFAP